jgi:hypothetical protein
MRHLAEPLPSMQCELCHGGLHLKRIERDVTAIQVDVAIYLCAKSGRQQSRRAIHDPYTAYASRGFARAAKYGLNCFRVHPERVQVSWGLGPRVPLIFGGDARPHFDIDRRGSKFQRRRRQCRTIVLPAIANRQRHGALAPDLGGSDNFAGGLRATSPGW